MADTRSKRILIVDDEPDVTELVSYHLRSKGFETETLNNPAQCIARIRTFQPDLIILDVMMPLKDGFTLAKEIRKIDKKIPILFLTAKTLQEDILEGLKIGADDYLTKPFSMEELLLRINAIFRRTNPDGTGDSQKTFFVLGKYSFDYSRQILAFEGNEQKLTSKEAQLLKMLCERTNDVLDRSLALNKIWLDDNYFNARSMDVYIAKLRKYLKEDGNVELLNVHGKGFKLVVNDTTKK